ncbi:hypothetical protein, partial [Sinorhizobium meliloti]|uniref:hypothetical protein n=1 Tax=Rhizobium meliloti TaxID=382 RepID=UPI001AECC74E
CSAKRSNMLAWTVRSWRIVGSGGYGFVFRISSLIQSIPETAGLCPRRYRDSPNKFSSLPFMDGH